MFRKDVKGFLPKLMEKMYGDRVIFKKKMLAVEKQQYEKTPTVALEKKSLDATTFKWRRRFLLTLLMVLLVINTSGITN